MPIALKPVTADAPEPWQALSGLAPLDYAREGVRTAPPRTLLRMAGWLVWSVIWRLMVALCWLVGATLTLLAVALLVTATLIRLTFTLAAGALFLLRRIGPIRLIRRLAARRRPPYAQTVF